MAHIPNKAVHHSLYVPGSERIPPALKPGQSDLHRKGLYIEEAKEEPLPFNAADLPSSSEYTNRVSSTIGPQHFLNPQRPFTGMRGGASLSSTMNGGTSHWRSEYRAAHGQSTLEGHEFTGKAGAPVLGMNEQGTSVGRSESSSAYNYDYGKYGSNPRDRIKLTDTKLPVFKSSLTSGTTKGTEHIPGYQGCIPAHPITKESVRAGRGQGSRAIDKVDITATMHLNLVGYTGHAPQSARNDFGGRKPTDLTTNGRDYVTPRRQHM